MQGPFDYSRSGGWEKVVNTGGFAIRPRGIMRITGVTVLEQGDVAYQVQTPNAFGDVLADHLINGPTEIPGSGSTNNIGIGRRTGPLIATFDSGSGTPAKGQNWGPVSGSDQLTLNSGGFICLGAPTNTSPDRALFMASPMRALKAKCTSSQAVLGQNTTTFTAWGGTTGSEVTTGQTLSAFVRYGIVFPNRFYTLNWTGAGFEAVPDTYFYALVSNGGFPITKGNTGSVTVWAGTAGSETSLGPSTNALARFGNVADASKVWCVLDASTDQSTWTIMETDTCPP